MNDIEGGSTTGGEVTGEGRLFSEMTPGEAVEGAWKIYCFDKFMDGDFIDGLQSLSEEDRARLQVYLATCRASLLEYIENGVGWEGSAEERLGYNLSLIAEIRDALAGVPQET